MYFRLTSIEKLELQRHQVSSKSFSSFNLVSAELLAIGGYDYSNEFDNVKTELYLPEEDRWKELADYPFVVDLPTRIKAYIMQYAALYHDGAFYVFGGGIRTGIYTDRCSQTIARLDTKTYKWSKVEFQNFHLNFLKFFVHSTRSWNFKE